MRLLGLLVFVASVVLASDQIQFISGGDTAAFGPDGTLYLLGTGRIETTPGAFLDKLLQPLRYLRRVDPAAGRVIYATYLPFYASALVVDSRGAVYLGGTYSDPVAITPGAYDRNLKNGEPMAIAKLNPVGSAMEFVTQIGGTREPALLSSPRIGGLALGATGDLYVTGTTCSKDFPATADAFQRTSRSRDCDAFLLSLSGDGARLLYASYLGGSANSTGDAIAIGDGGKVHLGGESSAADLPATVTGIWPDAPAPSGVRDSIFLTVWDPATRDLKTASLGTGLVGIRYAWNGRLAAMFGNHLWGGIPETPGALWPAAGNRFLAVLDLSSWKLVYITGLPGAPWVDAMALDEAGALTLTATGSDQIPATAGAHLLASSTERFAAKFDPSGTRLLYATYFDPPGFSFAAAIRPGIIYSLGGDVAFKADPPAFVTAGHLPPRDCSAIYAWPKTIQSCGKMPATPRLYWRTCDPFRDGATVRFGSPDGAVVGSTHTGSVEIAPRSATYYLVSRSGHILGKEEIRYEPAPRCSAVPSPTADMGADPNPVLSCRETPLSGTTTRVFGYGAPGPVDIRIDSVTGPKLSYGPSGFASEYTGEWLRDGTAFFLTPRDTPAALAMTRVYLLPIRSCDSPGAPVPPAIQAKPETLACGADRHSTLAWYSGGPVSVEIRQDGPAGPAIARFNSASGLFDVRPAATTTYHLMVYRDGRWRDLAAATVVVNRAACPDSRRRALARSMNGWNHFPAPRACGVRLLNRRNSKIICD